MALVGDIKQLTTPAGDTYTFKDSSAVSGVTKSGNTVTVTKRDGTSSTFEANDAPRVKSVTIPVASSWTQGTNSVTGSDLDHYYVTVTITGVTPTANTKVDLQPDVTAIAQMLLDETSALWIESVSNGSGGYILQAHCLGTAPSAALTIQCTCSEVSS